MDRDPGEGPFEAMGRLVRAASAPGAADDDAAEKRFVARVARGAGRRRGPVAAAVLAGVVGALLLRARPPHPSEVAAPAPVAARAPLAAPALLAPPGPPPLLGPGTVMRFEDGSVLDLETDGRGRLAEVTARGARVVLEQGSLAVRVTPRPGARWSVQAGPFTVEVTGTAFHVAWRAGTFEVAMTEGHVTVVDPRFQQGLFAGQRLVATAEAGIVSLGPALAAPARAGSPARPATRRPTIHRTALVSETTPVRDWSQRVAHGDFGSVVAEARAAGIDAALRQQGLAELEALGTAARLARESELATRVFQSIRRRFPGSEPARQAAFHLGRLADDEQRDPTAAVGWFDRYIAESPRGDLAAEALGRRMMALDRQRGPTAAPTQLAARDYLARFPDGPHAASARLILQGR